MKILKIFIFRVLLPVALVVFWICVPVVINSNSPISVISSTYNKSIFHPFSQDEIYKGEKVNGDFVSKENNLGILAVRFNTFSRINSDSVIFRIKEDRDTSWFYEGKYKVDQFQPDDFFTFGFPVIHNSQNRRYVFQIESIKGEPDDAVAISNINPIAMAKYQFTKAELLQNKKTLPFFIFKKIYYSFNDLGFAVASLPYLIPLILYILLLKHYRRFRKIKLFYLSLFTLIVVLNALFLPSLSEIGNLLLITFWIFIIIVNKLDSSVSFFYALIFLCFVPFMIFFGHELISENFAIWVYYFLLIGTIQAIYEAKNPLQNKITYIDVIKAFIGVKNYLIIFSKLKLLEKL